MDIKLNYMEHGQGDVLILLHGNGEDISYFRNQTDFFAKKYRVIAVDTRGHGSSPRGTAPFTLSQFAEDLHGLMDDLGIDQANILGFSDGANIALLFALKYPQRVLKLILNGGNLFPEGVKRSVQLPIEIGYRLAEKFAGKSPEARLNAETLGLMVNEPHISVQELSALKIKTLVIAGTRDMIKESHTRLIAENIPDARLVFIKGDHFIANKKHAEFNRAVEEFMEEQTWVYGERAFLTMTGQRT